jgi:twitching motility protein PilT
VPAVEVLISTASVREAITDPTKTNTIIDLVEQGAIQYGMQSFDQSIMRMYRSGHISYEEALGQCSNPDDFDLRVKGITSASDRGWVEFEQRDKSKEKLSF